MEGAIQFQLQLRTPGLPAAHREVVEPGGETTGHPSAMRRESRMTKGDAEEKGGVGLVPAAAAATNAGPQARPSAAPAGGEVPVTALGEGWILTRFAGEETVLTECA